jgi:hypothetical protein
MRNSIYETILLEMARAHPTSVDNMFSDHTVSKLLGDQAKKQPVHKWIGTPNNHTIHISSYGRSHEYTTVHNNGRAVHNSVFTNNKHPQLPFKHTVQSAANRDPDHKDLGKHYVSNLALHHMEHTKTPLVSDSEQTEAGHKMWHHITKTAMDKGHHVYHWDGAKLHKITPENHSEHMAKSFGETSEHTKKHMVVSPHDLEKK